MDAHNNSASYLLENKDLPDNSDMLFWTAFKLAIQNLINL